MGGWFCRTDRFSGRPHPSVDGVPAFRHRIAAGLVAVLLSGACASSPPTESASADPFATSTSAPQGGPVEPILVIVDYSPTVSDVGGLMYLLAHPNVEVIAVTLPATGEAGCDLGIEVTLGILEMFDQARIPVACDPTVPAHAQSWPGEFLEGHENLASGLPAATGAASDELASDLMARIAKESDRPVVVYAVAPLTNVAKALSDNPDLIQNIERIVIMGGAVNVSGNVSGTDAEWNLWIDAPAAARVVSSGVPITLIPLDATNRVPVTDRYRGVLEDGEQSDAIVYLNRLVGLFPAVSSGFYYLWDELAASVAAGETFVTTEEISIVVSDDGPNAGRTTRVDGATVTVATGVEDPDSFYVHFVGTLAASSP